MSDNEKEKTDIENQKLEELLELNQEIFRRLSQVEEKLKKEPYLTIYSLLISIAFALVITGASVIANIFSQTQKVSFGAGLIILGYMLLAAPKIIESIRKYLKRK